MKAKFLPLVLCLAVICSCQTRNSCPCQNNNECPCCSSENTESSPAPVVTKAETTDPNAITDAEAFTFLQKIYPAGYNDDRHDYTAPVMDRSTVMTERCVNYTGQECDFDPIYQTQDHYSCTDDVNPKITKSASFPNTYIVKWDGGAGEGDSRKATLVLVKQSGKILIDNFIDEDNNLYFDYSKPAVSIYD